MANSYAKLEISPQMQGNVMKYQLHLMYLHLIALKISVIVFKYKTLYKGRALGISMATGDIQQENGCYLICRTLLKRNILHPNFLLPKIKNGG